MNALARAVEILGSQHKLAQAIGVKQQSIYVWLKAGGRLPAERVLAVEKATDGKVTRYDLRPDIYPKERRNGKHP